VLTWIAWQGAGQPTVSEPAREPQESRGEVPALRQGWTDGRHSPQCARATVEGEEEEGALVFVYQGGARKVPEAEETAPKGSGEGPTERGGGGGNFPPVERECVRVWGVRGGEEEQEGEGGTGVGGESGEGENDARLASDAPHRSRSQLHVTPSPPPPGPGPVPCVRASLTLR